jgi:hypothetical protein
MEETRPVLQQSLVLFGVNDMVSASPDNATLAGHPSPWAKHVAVPWGIVDSPVSLRADQRSWTGSPSTTFPVDLNSVRAVLAASPEDRGLFVEMARAGHLDAAYQLLSRLSDEYVSTVAAPSTDMATAERPFALFLEALQHVSAPAAEVSFGTECVSIPFSEADGAWSGQGVQVLHAYPYVGDCVLLVSRVVVRDRAPLPAVTASKMLYAQCTPPRDSSGSEVKPWKAPTLADRVYVSAYVCESSVNARQGRKLSVDLKSALHTWAQKVLRDGSSFMLLYCGPGVEPIRLRDVFSRSRFVRESEDSVDSELALDQLWAEHACATLQRPLHRSGFVVSLDDLSISSDDVGLLVLFAWSEELRAAADEHVPLWLSRLGTPSIHAEDRLYFACEVPPHPSSPEHPLHVLANVLSYSTVSGLAYGTLGSSGFMGIIRQYLLSLSTQLLPGDSLVADLKSCGVTGVPSTAGAQLLKRAEVLDAAGAGGVSVRQLIFECVHRTLLTEGRTVPQLGGDDLKVVGNLNITGFNSVDITLRYRPPSSVFSGRGKTAAELVAGLADPDTVFGACPAGSMRLFHGTDAFGAYSILVIGVNVDCCSPYTDFGQGLYMTTSIAYAVAIAYARAEESSGDVAVIAVDIPHAAFNPGRPLSALVLDGELWVHSVGCFRRSTLRSLTPAVRDAPVLYGAVVSNATLVEMTHPSPAVPSCIAQYAFKTQDTAAMVVNGRYPVTVLRCQTPSMATAGSVAAVLHEITSPGALRAVPTSGGASAGPGSARGARPK